MPGILYAEAAPGQLPTPNEYFYSSANSLSGTGTPPAAAMQAGDVVALTTASALTASSQVVSRMLLAADVSALYQDGSGNVCGVLGVCADSFTTNASGVAGAPPALGAVTSGAAINYPLSVPAMQGNDSSTGRSFMRVHLFRPGQRFKGRLYTGGGSVTLTHQYDNTLAGFNLSTSSGVTTYTVSPAATTKCLTIIGPVLDDPLYGQLVAQNSPGPWVIFEVLPSFSQSDTGFNYSAQ